MGVILDSSEIIALERNRGITTNRRDFEKIEGLRFEVRG